MTDMYNKQTTPELPSSPEASSSRPRPSRLPSSAIRHNQSRPNLRSRQSLMDELLPIPITSPSQLLNPSAGSTVNTMTHSIRRSGSLAVIVVFLVTIVFMASTSENGLVSSVGLKEVFRIGSLAGQGGASSVEELDALKSGKGKGGKEEGEAGSPDFDQYTMLKTLSAKDIQLDTSGKRVIFIGDVHGSLDPLKRLMDKLKYNPKVDRLIHVGDLIAKGTKNDEVLTWMRENQIQGVRGNHDQPVIQWRAWMEWVGGAKWESSLDSFASQSDEEVIEDLKKQGKMFPKKWEWKGEHWKIAKSISKDNYKYLVNLPLVLHLPSLHTFIVHAGLLPSNPLKANTDASQPLQLASALIDSSSASSAMSETARTKEELAILSIPQNKIPWNLINMRSIYMRKGKGKDKGEITKSGKKGNGTPWSEVWGEAMEGCTAGSLGDSTQDGSSGDIEGEEGNEDEGVLEEEEEEVDEDDRPRHEITNSNQRKRMVKRRDLHARKGKGKGMSCSPVTVIYGHAAGRGLDIKQFSKGIDTGCVYGHELTALVLGDVNGIKGDPVQVDAYYGKLVSVSCKKGGL